MLGTRLSIFRQQEGAASFGSLLRQALWPVAGALCLLGAALLVGLLVFGSTQAMLAFLRNEPLLCRRSHADLGEVAADSSRAVSYTLENVATYPVTIVGAESSCVCVLADWEKFPIELAPSTKRTLSFTVHTPSKKGRFEYSVGLYLAEREAPLMLTLQGSVY